MASDSSNPGIEACSGVAPFLKELADKVVSIRCSNFRFESADVLTRRLPLSPFTKNDG